MTGMAAPNSPSASGPKNTTAAMIMPRPSSPSRTSLKASQMALSIPSPMQITTKKMIISSMEGHCFSSGGSIASSIFPAVISFTASGSVVQSVKRLLSTMPFFFFTTHFLSAV